MKEALWHEVEAALDARIDPFDVPELARAVAQDPEAAEELGRLMNRLEMLGETRSQEPTSSPLARRIVSVAAGLFLLASAIVLWRMKRPTLEVEAARSETAGVIDTITLTVEHETAPPPRVARVVLEPRRVLAWTLEGETP